ncbi:hypothetical protein BYT27DRAFT_7206368 [Phlegmacium glaucopus]|nr:hypothetical protein BYT27DRAFT_7206368 [Phlegmacium glaucopus]
MEGVRLNLVRNGQWNVFLAYGSRSVNSMVDQLSAFAYEVTRVALEVGMQGILGGRVRVEGVWGTWADLIRNVSKVTSNLADQVAFVNFDVQEEMLDLEMTVNSIATQLRTLANEVTQVSLEVRRGGILGGQAFVPEVQGMWKVLTDNVNLMAMNLTNQVRSIAEVTKAVVGGDLIEDNVERSGIERGSQWND